MSGLSEFLLARIAEDEAGARYVQAREANGDPALQWFGQPFAARILAECGAKRRIVEEFVAGSDPGDWGDIALRYLAAVYADHSDYRQEWRP